MKARELRADYLVLVAPSSDQPDYLTPSAISAAISRGLHTKSEPIDPKLVKRKQEFFESILCLESTRKAFILLVT